MHSMECCNQILPPRCFVLSAETSLAHDADIELKTDSSLLPIQQTKCSTLPETSAPSA